MKISSTRQMSKPQRRLAMVTCSFHLALLGSTSPLLAQTSNTAQTNGIAKIGIGFENLEFSSLTLRLTDPRRS